MWSMPTKLRKEQAVAVSEQAQQAENVGAVSMQEPQAQNVGLGPQDPTHARFFLDKLFGVGKKGQKEKKSYYNTVNYYYPNKGGHEGGYGDGNSGGYGGGYGGNGGHGGHEYGGHDDYGVHGGYGGHGDGGYRQEYNTNNDSNGGKKGYKKGLFGRSQQKADEVGDIPANIGVEGSNN